MIGFILKILSHVDKYYKVYYLLYKSMKFLVTKFKNNKTMEGYWSKEAEKGAGKFFDDKVKSPVWFEPFDGMLATYGASWLDNTYSVKMPEQFVEAYKKIGTAFEKYYVEGEVTLSDFVESGDIATIVDGFIDVPKMTDDTEAIMFAALMKGVFDVVGSILNKEKE